MKRRRIGLGSAAGHSTLGPDNGEYDFSETADEDSQATAAGVVEVTSTHREFTNPNKWDKHLAPWFSA